MVGPVITLVVARPIILIFVIIVAIMAVGRLRGGNRLVPFCSCLGVLPSLVPIRGPILSPIITTVVGLVSPPPTVAVGGTWGRSFTVPPWATSLSSVPAGTPGVVTSVSAEIML